MLAEVREIHRVPGKWRCIHCGGRLTTAPDVTERPLCPTGCETPMVALSWKIHGPEQEEVLEQLQGMLQRALVRSDEECERNEALVKAVASAVEGAAEREEVFSRQIAATWRLVYWASLAASLIGGLAGFLVGRA